MRRPLILATLAIVAHASLARSEPIAIKGTKTAVWNNPTGGPSTGAGTNWLRFGEYDAGSIGWAGNLRFSTTEGTPFLLGSFTLTNGSSLDPPTQMTFSMTLDFRRPTDEDPATFDFDAYLLSTNRNGGGDLTFSIVPGQTSTWTSSNGTTYSLEMLGLSNNWEWDGQTFAEITASADCADNQTYAMIYGRLTIEDPVTVAHVPEPSALLLSGIGLAFLAMRRRSKRLTA